MLYTNRDFKSETVTLDGNHFVDCRFYECRLVFSADEPVSFDRCVFSECDWVFGGSAEIMLGFLTALYHGLGISGEQLVGLIFERIRQGVVGSNPASKAIA